MTNEELTHLEALCNAATPGPWERPRDCGCGDGYGCDDRMPRRTVLAKDRCRDTRDPDYTGKVYVVRDTRPEDAAFIAAARQAVPALLARVRYLEAALLEARAECSTLRATTEGP